MSAIEYFCEEGVVLDLEAGDKEGVIRRLVEAAAAMGKIKRGRAEEVVAKVLEREEIGSTGIGHGVAVPHARAAGVKELVGVFGRLREPVEFQALDGRPVDLVFLLLSPTPSSGEHLEVLAALAMIARHELYRRFLRQAKDAEEAYEVLKEAFEEAGS